jgi:two-component system, OmpR family, sensor histidine kinase CreC
MRIGLRILLGYFLIVAVAAILLARVFVQEVKPGVRQAMEDTLVDTANLLAGQARDDLLAGRIDDGPFAAERARADRPGPGRRDLGFQQAPRPHAHVRDRRERHRGVRLQRTRTSARTIRAGTTST